MKVYLKLPNWTLITFSFHQSVYIFKTQHFSFIWNTRGDDTCSQFHIAMPFKACVAESRIVMAPVGQYFCKKFEII